MCGSEENQALLQASLSTASQSVGRKKTQAAASVPSDASDEGEGRKRSKREAEPVKEIKDTKASGNKSPEVKKPATSQSSEDFYDDGSSGNTTEQSGNRKLGAKMVNTSLGALTNGSTSVVENGNQKRKLGAKMEVHAENTSLGALTNGSTFEVDDDNQKQSPKLLTLVIIKKDGKVLLGMKKRGFGVGYFNGFGGKVEANETIDEAAVRELQEESGVVPVSMEKRGILTFHFDDNPQPWEVHVYHVGDYAGEPCETEEMAPRWFSVADIPYDKMWQDDPIWYPAFLQGRHFKGDFYFHNTHTLVSHTLHILQKLDA